jgi:hypothetical protein
MRTDLSPDFIEDLENTVARALKSARAGFGHLEADNLTMLALSASSSHKAHAERVHERDRYRNRMIMYKAMLVKNGIDPRTGKPISK